MYVTGRMFFCEPATNKSAVSITIVTITNSRNRTILTTTPNEYPATRYSVKRDLGDDYPIDFILVCARIFH
jgi:Arf-GAP/SH3 domain/ANK repeat/PH domain-containing protein